MKSSASISIKAEGQGPSRIANRFGGNVLSRSRFQNQDDPAVANSGFLSVLQGDNAGGQPTANVRLNTSRHHRPENQLHLPGGDLHWIEITGFTFIRNLEVFYRTP